MADTAETKRKLQNGLIPPGTPCPFKDQCRAVAAGLCKHKGTEHRVPFSCGFARAFEMFE